MRSLVRIMIKINFLSKWKENLAIQVLRMPNINLKSKKRWIHLCCFQICNKREKVSQGKTIMKCRLCNKIRVSWKCKKCSTITKKLVQHEWGISFERIAIMFQGWRRALHGRCHLVRGCTAWKRGLMLIIELIGRIIRQRMSNIKLQKRRHLFCERSLERVKACNRRFRFALVTK